jgi:hypothetical protein
MARKRKVIKDVRCSVRLMVSGVCRKTVKRRISMAQAIREIGSDPVETEGRLLTGVPLNRKRTVARGVTVVLMYVADHRIQCEVSLCVPCDMQAALGVIRAGINV